MAVISYFWRGICFVAHVCYQRKGKHLKIFFSMLHHEESSKKTSILYGKPISAQSPPPLYCTVRTMG